MTLHSLPGPEDIIRQELPNGIVVLTRPNPGSLSVVVTGYLSAGAIFEADDKLGLAGFTAMSLMRGTAQHSFQQIYDALESNGASLGLDGGTHSIGFYGHSLSEDLDLLVGTLAEAIQQPVFPSEHVERLRNQLLTSLAIRAQDTSEMASLAFDDLVYAGHPYSRPEDGYPETIRAITRDDLAEFHKKHFGPWGMVVSIVGGVETEQAMDAVIRFLGDWKNTGQPDQPALPPVRLIEKMITRQVHIPGKSEADIVMGTAGPPRTSPDFLTASLGNNILGQFGMYGRIGESVREKSGLAYHASSSLSGGIGPGPWLFIAGVDPKNLDKVIELMKQEIARFINELITGEELDDSQANYIGRLPLSLESNGGVASALLNLERYNLGLDYYIHYPDLVRAITPEAILETARKYLHPDRLAIATAGTFKAES
ncbi:MAG TPA: pitrilysin family protein [Anaerolineales bacterium]|nr:pitrilysin family protein [Anaerolineales bacterium]